VDDRVGEAVEHQADVCYHVIGPADHEAAFGFRVLGRAGHRSVDEWPPLASISAAIFIVEAGSAVEQSAMTRPSRTAPEAMLAVDELFDLQRTGDAEMTSQPRAMACAFVRSVAPFEIDRHWAAVAMCHDDELVTLRQDILADAVAHEAHADGADLEVMVPPFTMWGRGDAFGSGRAQSSVPGTRRRGVRGTQPRTRNECDVTSHRLPA
jgi:hypothetical protein